MTPLLANLTIGFVAVIEAAGVPALRVAVSIAVVVLLCAGVFIFRRRHQYFDCDPNIENDGPAVRHIRLEQMLFVWSALTLVLISILYPLWRA